MMKKERIFILLLMWAFVSVASAQETDASESNLYFIDGVDFQEFGSYLCLEDVITPYDWRNRSFEDFPTYWDYYGVTDIYVDLASLECNLNGVWQSLPVTLIVGVDKTNLSGTYYKQNPAEGTVTSRYGFLTYKNNGTSVSSDFQIRFYASMDYKWGTVTTEHKIVVDVKSTATTGIDGVSAASQGMDVYTLQGEKVRSDAATLQGLPKGVYIVNGRKVVNR